MTEDEAKTKWCPESRLHVNGWAATPYNRFLNDDDHDSLVSIPTACKCIASECMWWVTERVSGEFKFEPTENEGEVVCTESPNYSGHCGAIR